MIYKQYTGHKRGSLNPLLWKAREHVVPADPELADAVESSDSMQIITRLDGFDDVDACAGELDSSSDEEEPEELD